MALSRKDKSLLVLHIIPDHHYQQRHHHHHYHYHHDHYYRRRSRRHYPHIYVYLIITLPHPPRLGDQTRTHVYS